MNVINILWRNIKWRFQNPLSVIITILQPMIWLILFSMVASQTMGNIGIRNYTQFILPGIIVLVSFSACSSGGIINFIMKTSGSFYRILIAPIHRSCIVLGQLFESIICTFFEVTIICFVCLLFNVNFESGIIGILLMIIIIFLTAFFMSGLAYTISLILPNEVMYETVMNAIVLPIFFLSTALFPSNELSGVLKVIINLNPFTHVINSLRSLILSQSIKIQSILPVLLMLFIMCCCSFGLALWRLNKETVH